jgi:hypothetical protein
LLIIDYQLIANGKVEKFEAQKFGTRAISCVTLQKK